MKSDQAEGTAADGLVDQRFMVRVFIVFLFLALFAVGLSVASSWIGRSLVMAGHTDDATTREIVIGNDVFALSANTIRDPGARADGAYNRMDLYLAWPTMSGYTRDLRDSFNHAGSEAGIIFLAIEPETMSRDMSGRLEPIYRSLVSPQGRTGPAGLTLYDFPAGSGFSDEVLAVGRPEGGGAFVARCLIGEAAADSLAPCQRDVSIGGGLAAAYRFPVRLLDEWRMLDRQLLGWLAARRQTPAM